MASFESSTVVAHAGNTRLRRPAVVRTVSAVGTAFVVNAVSSRQRDR
ncbi:MAG TPA: hypothetical protein VFG87_27600 [Amycolatopsis sp.]|nr:hypothetical protein [Amycolatopsis sp.]